MERDTSETIYTLVIIGLKDDRAKRRVAAALSRVTTQMSADRILERLGSLPWTLTRRATQKRATRLVRLLEGLGARIRVIPPLPEAEAPDIGETQILSSAELISETQIASATQFVERPEEVHPSEAALKTPGVVARPAVVAPSAGEAPPSAVAPEPQKPQRGLRVESEPSVDENIPMEPLTVGGILDRSFQIDRAYFWKLATIMVIPGLLTEVISGIGLVGGSALGLSASSVLAWPAWVWVVVTIVVIPLVVVGLAISLYLPRAALIYAISEICLGRDFRVMDAFRAALPRLVPFVLTSLLFALALFGTYLASALSAGVLGLLYSLFVSWLLPRSLVWLAWLPAIMMIPVFVALPMYVWVRWSLYEQALMLEDFAYGGALQRSWHLLSGRVGKQWYTTHVTRLGILLIVFAVIQVSVSLIFQGPAVLFTYASSWHVIGRIATHVLSLCVTVIMGVFAATFLVLFYYDLRTRKEGLDLMLPARENAGHREG